MKDKKHGLSTFKEEDKLVLHNVIGGLEEKIGIIIGMNERSLGIEQGHNQLCNKEVEVDGDFKENLKNLKIETVLAGSIPTNSILRELIGEHYCEEIFGLISKALSQGKVIKVKE